MRRILLILAFLPFLTGWGATVANDTVVSFITCGTGADIYELEGHSGIRIRTPQYDVVINYGLFDFNAPGFVYRFVKGETDYSCGAIEYQSFMTAYRHEKRSVTEQVLDFTSEQKKRLMAAVAEDLLPQNSTYRYNYVKDNCATRPLRALERAAGSGLVLGAAPSYTTFRNAMRQYHENYPWYQFGIDLALGSGIDYEISDHEKAFAPVALQAMLDGATIDGRPLVKATNVLYAGAPGGVTEGPTPWLLRPSTVMWLLALLILWCCYRDVKRGKVTRWVWSAWFALLGLTGCIITFLVLVSEHEATSPNWLILALNPLALLCSVGVWVKSMARVVDWCYIVNLALLVLMVVIWPFTGQSMNAAMIPVFIADAALSGVWIYLKKYKGICGH